MVALHSNHWLESFQRLDRSLEPIDRGSMLCLIAAWAMIVRMRL